MSPLPIPTKLQLPAPRPGLVLRPRLVQKLNAGLDGKLTLISASTGFGKTTLASLWLRQCGRPAAWLALDELDNDPLRFLSYLIRALQTIHPGFGADLLESLTTASPQDFDLVPVPLLEALTAEIAALQTYFLLALDDYHLITRPAIQGILQFLLTHQPANLHLVLVSRADPPWPLGRLRARREMNEIRVADLRFSPQEAAEFLNTCMGLGLTSEQVTALETRTEGWIAGLQLAALSLQGQANPQELITSLAGSQRFIADYLIEEVLEKQPPEVQDFLLKTAVLDQMNAELCAEVTGRTDSQATLLQLEQSNLFLIPLDQERNWYRYHHLFADLLRIKLGQVHPGLTAELQCRASAWHSAQGRRLEALHYALAAGDIQMVERLFAGNVFLLFRQDEVGAVFQKLEALPVSLVSDKPWLGIARAFLVENGQFQKSHQILETIAAQVENMPESAEKHRLRGHLEAAWAGIYGLQGDVANTVYHAQQAENWLPPEEVETRASNLALWGDILSKEGHDPNAMPILERALELALQAEKPHAVIMVSSALAMGHLGAGRLREAHRVCQQALAVADDYQKRTGQEILAVAMNYAILARIYIEWDEMEKSSQFGFKGLALSERLGDVGSEVMCREYLGHTLMFQDDSTQGIQVYQRALELAANLSPWVEQMTAGLMVDGLLDREPADQAAVRESLRVYDETQMEYPLTLKARLLLKTGQPAAALEVLDNALAGMRAEVARLTVRPHVFRALALQALGDESAALAALTQALTLSEPENRMMTFLREGQAMEKLLRVADRKAICPEFTRHLLAAFARREKPVAEALIEPFSERELDVLRLLATNLDAPEIAEKLIISANTVRTHIKNLYRKLNVHSRHEALARARELKLV
ncbi:MAG: LuxR C-terminal-related transcriptional regulator [Anaerolineae bacterium]|nr:LuxR C-terminal-related transcriptional regulator [Anaerolineae bacterium]